MPARALSGLQTSTCDPRVLPAGHSNSKFSAATPCGYCAESIGQARVGARETVESVAYRDVLQGSELPPLARTLFCAALVYEGTGEPEAAAWRFLQAAWACDDSGSQAAGRICRERAAEMFHRVLETGEVETPRAVVLTLSADLWRRAGRFDDAILAASEAEHLLSASDESAETTGASVVASYIRGLAECGDGELHSAAEAFSGEGE